MRTYFKHLAIIALSLPLCAVQAQIVTEAYAWPSVDRSYWPTIRWETAPFDKHGLELNEITRIDRMALDDEKMRALLVVKDGLLVLERYYHGGAVDQSTEVWSVTKSIVSALIGVMLQKKQIDDIDTRMSHFLSKYPEFGNITIRHVLNHTTGLSWAEEGPEFVGWIGSDDWVSNALSRPRLHPPGAAFLYSSGNSHFLSALVHAATGKTPGEYADEHLFVPLGIRFQRSTGFEGRPSWKAS